MSILGALAIVPSMAVPALARDQIRIVGSSTVYPFATAVAEEFGNASKFKTPIVESTGTGGGFKLFCGGVGEDTPDISDASRRIEPSEFQRCSGNGVTEITEIKIGYDGIVIANAKTSAPLSLTRRELFLALAKEVPAANGALVPNPNRTWKQVDASLPDRKIEVLGPPPTSGTRDAFSELVLDAGCETFPEIAALKKQNKVRFKQVCQSIREDGAYIEAGENDNLIVQKLETNPDAFGVFGFSYLGQNEDRIQGQRVEGVAPTFENISDGSYPVSRPLFIYVKKAHVKTIPGMREYLAAFTSEDAMGEFGYLADKGLIPASKAERETARAAATSLPAISAADLKPE